MLSEWAFSTKKPYPQKLCWSNDNYVAHSYGPIVTVSIFKDRELKPFASLSLLKSNITCLAWNVGPDTNGITRSYLIMGSENGKIAIYEATTNQVVIMCEISKSPIIAAHFSPVDCTRCYLSTAASAFACITLNYNCTVDKTPAAKINWRIETNFVVHYIDCGLDDPVTILIGSKDGRAAYVHDVGLHDALVPEIPSPSDSSDKNSQSMPSSPKADRDDKDDNSDHSIQKSDTSELIDIQEPKQPENPEQNPPPSSPQQAPPEKPRHRKHKPRLSPVITIKEGAEVVAVRRFGSWEHSVLVVAKHAVYLYRRGGAVIRLYIAESKRDPIVDGFVLPGDGSVLVVVFSTHVRLFDITRGRTDTVREVCKTLLPTRGGPPAWCCTAQQGHTVALVSRGGGTQFMEASSRGLSAVSVTRGLCCRPKAMDILGGFIIIGGANGIVQVGEVFFQTVSRTIKSFKGDIVEARWLSTQLAVVVERAGGTHQAHLLDVATGRTRPLLKKAVEILASDPVEVAVSRNRQLFTLTVAHNIICLYDASGNLIVTVFEKGKNLVAFGSKDTELWILNTNLYLKRFAIDLKGSEKVSLERATRLSTLRGKATSLACLNGAIAVGDSSGFVYVYDWYGTPPVVSHAFATQSSSTPVSVKRFVASPTWGSGFALSNDGRCVRIQFGDDDTATISSEVRKASLLSYITEDALALVYKGHPAISIRDAAFRSVAYDAITKPYTSAHLSEGVKFNFSGLSKSDISEKLREMNQFIAADFVDALNGKFHLLSQGAGCTKETAMAHLRMHYFILQESDNPNLREMRVHTALIVGDRDGARDALMATQRESPSFGVNVMKAALFESNGFGDLSAVVSRLQSAGMVDDAVDVLLIAGDVGAALRLLFDAGERQHSFLAARALGLAGEEGARLSLLGECCERLEAEGRGVVAACIKASLGEVGSAVEMLERGPQQFHVIAEVLRQL